MNLIAYSCFGSVLLWGRILSNTPLSPETQKEGSVVCSSAIGLDSIGWMDWMWVVSWFRLRAFPPLHSQYSDDPLAPPLS